MHLTANHLIMFFSSPQIWIDVSDNARDLISKLLEKDVEKRLSAAETLNHPWLEDVSTCPFNQLLNYFIILVCSLQMTSSFSFLDQDVPETPLVTPTTLRRFVTFFQVQLDSFIFIFSLMSFRNPSIHEELSFFTASCLKCTRKMSSHYEQRPFALSPPGSSSLAHRRGGGDDKGGHINESSNNHSLPLSQYEQTLLIPLIISCSFNSHPFLYFCIFYS